MLFSIRISKIFESRAIYDLLKEENTAVNLLFVLCNRLALDGAINHGKEFLEDLKNGKLQEIPDYDVNLVTKHENYIRTGKMEYDMTLMAKDHETIGELLYKLFKDVWDLTTIDLYFDNDDKLLVMIDLLKSIDSTIQDAPASLYENNFPNLMKRFDWTEVEEEYQKEKKRNCVTMDWLQEKQEDVLKEALECYCRCVVGILPALMSARPKIDRRYAPDGACRRFFYCLMICYTRIPIIVSWKSDISADLSSSRDAAQHLHEELLNLVWCIFHPNLYITLLGTFHPNPYITLLGTFHPNPYITLWSIFHANL